jgi:hypothetical protein
VNHVNQALSRHQGRKQVSIFATMTTFKTIIMFPSFDIDRLSQRQVMHDFTLIWRLEIQGPAYGVTCWILRPELWEAKNKQAENEPPEEKKQASEPERSLWRLNYRTKRAHWWLPY